MKEMIKSLTTGENQDKIIPLKSQNFGDIPKEIMNITKFINFENYYCQITPLFRELLNNRISNYSSTARQINSSSNTVRRILKIENYFININTLINLGNNHGIQRSTVLKNICSIKTKTSFPVEFNLKDLISPSLFRVIGNFLGDGGIHTNVPEGKYRPFYANQSHTLINQFVIDIKKLFGDFKIYQRRKPTNVKEVWLPTTLGHFFFELLEYDKNKFNKRIPPFVFDKNNLHLAKYLLQGLYDDEGFLYPQKSMIVISQKSKELLQDIHKLVQSIGIRPNQILIHHPRNRTKMFYFSITKKENILKFAELIGFKHPVKKDKLRILVAKYSGGFPCVE